MAAGSPSLNSPVARSPRRNGGYVVSPSYSRVSDKLRRISAGSLQCAMFCGGSRCKYETPGKWRDEDKVLKGLFSHWVTRDVLAMARPSTALFRENELIGKLKSVGIGTVINLQLPGEHAKCGPGLEASGFTYHPEELMRHGVYFYNYGWMDYGIPTLESVLDMVKVVDFALQDGCVAIHCHAGLGRTGVLIACYLVFSWRLSGDEAIAHVREKRPGSIQTRQQIDIVQQFHLFLCPLWNLYPTPSLTFTFEEYLHNQNRLLHGLKRRELKYKPKVIDEICSRLLQVCTKSHDKNQPISFEYPSDVMLHHTLDGLLVDMSVEGQMMKCFLYDDEMSETLAHRLRSIEVEMNSGLQWTHLSQESHPTVLFTLLTQYFLQLKESFLGLSDVSVLKENPSMDALSLAKSFTLRCVLDIIWKVLPQRLLQKYGHLLATKLASIFLKSKRDPPSCDSDERHISVLVSFINGYWVQA